MERTVFSLFAGVVTGVVCTTVLEAISKWIFPPLPASQALGFKERLAQGEVLPAGFFLLAAPAWGVASFLGAWLAGWIARRAPREHGLIVGAFLLLFAVWSLVSSGSPFWFWVLGLSMIPLGAWLGAMLAARMQV